VAATRDRVRADRGGAAGGAAAAAAAAAAGGADGGSAAAADLGQQFHDVQNEDPRTVVGQLERRIAAMELERVTIYRDLERRIAATGASASGAGLIAAVEQGPAHNGAATGDSASGAAVEDADEKWPIIKPRRDGADYAWDEVHGQYRCITCNKLLSSDMHFASYTHQNRIGWIRADAQQRQLALMQ
jgi:hypothetical protein